MSRPGMASDARLERLLDLYSVQKLSYHFGSTEKTKQSIVQDIVASNHRDQIIDFAFQNHTTAKHHIQLFEYSRADLGRLPDDPLELPSLERTENSASSRTWFYLVELSYSVVLREPLEMVPLDFLWPIRIHCTPTLMELNFTIMEKNLLSRFPVGRVVRAIRALDEATIEKKVRGSIDLPNLRSADLNRGVKSLWESGMIDAPAVQWKKARATTRQIMDGDYLLRRDDGILYQELVDKPLFSAVFKWVGSNDVSIDHFAVDATQGTLTFRTFSDLATGADYVVREILKRN